MKMRSAGACLAVAAALLVGCGNSSSTSATPAVLINGNYEGVVADSLDGEGILILTISQNGSTISGNYLATYAGGTVGGSISGSVDNATTMSATLTPSEAGVCVLSLTGTISSGGSPISGTYAAVNCSGNETGVFKVNR